ncbi:MAG TPA: glycoside hydrolase family 15 protein, partial [Puia sp.]|nr:glycoside hydrolase family 15 protein [Puia sp.]
VLVSLLPLYTDKRLIFLKKSSYRKIVPWLLNQIERTLSMPDSGLWEFRKEVQVHTYTLLFHWAGAKAAYKIGALFGDTELMKKAALLAAAADKLMDQCYDPQRKLYTQAIGTANLDASTLTMITMDYLSHDSGKAREHIAGLEKELLAENSLFYRYKHYDDFGFPESTFLVCAFWYVDALACVGRTDDAIRNLEKLLTYGNHLGIFSEDATTDGSQWGNFPQTYSHVGLINSVCRISRKLDRADFM